MFSLVVLNGPAAGTTLRLDPATPTVTIGRQPSRQLQLDDDQASRLHARVWYHAGQWHVEDCGSLNGTFVNSQPIQQVVLEPGDLIRIAGRLILFAKDSENRREARLKPSLLKSTAAIKSMPTGRPPPAQVDQSLSDSMSRVVRDSAVLCRLANQLHRHTDVKMLVRLAIGALADGIGADAVSIWLVGTDGRLRCAGRRGKSSQADSDAHVLASLAVENDKPFLIDHSDDAEDSTIGDSATAPGNALAVPISGQKNPRGAIECHHLSGQQVFARSDLDFAIVVAHQTGLALENLEHRQRLEQANLELRRRLDGQTQLVGSSREMQEVLDQIARVGPTASTVLILGESGTGKELVAQSIHELSEHSAGPYIAVSCAAFAESLLESELFGHEPGAFTGADRLRLGQFERAHRGTIFLDEIGEMSSACQAKLLRLLEGHPFERLGGEKLIHVDVRMIAATHRDLRELIRQGRFREDLYHRLRVIEIRVPPLRQRGDDVLELASLFVDRFRQQISRGPLRLSQEAVQAIRRYPWPGNVRELKNAIERAVVFAESDELTPADLGLLSQDTGEAPQPRLVSLKEAECRHIQYVMQHVGGNKTQACHILKIGRGTLYKKLDGSTNSQQSLPQDG